MSLQARYTILRKIADGGTAEIFLAIQKGVQGFEKPVVIKRIFPAYYADPQFRDMLINEAHIAMSLNHSNIVQVLDLGETDGQYLLALELVDGWTLDAVLRRARAAHASLPPALALYLTAEVCRALAYAHAKTSLDGKPLGIIHRDISPHNVLLSEQGEVKLTDFGIATSARDRRDPNPEKVIKGKIAYMSPEQASGEPLDARSDLFSVGTMLYVMICRRFPFDAPTDLEVLLLVKNGEFTPPEIARPGLNPEMYRVMKRAMAKAPADRYQRAEDMLLDVEQVMRVAFRAVGQTELKRWLLDLSARDGIPPLTKAPSAPGAATAPPPPPPPAVGDGPPRTRSSTGVKPPPPPAALSVGRRTARVAIPAPPTPSPPPHPGDGSAPATILPPPETSTDAPPSEDGALTAAAASQAPIAAASSASPSDERPVVAASNDPDAVSGAFSAPVREPTGPALRVVPTAAMRARRRLMRAGLGLLGVIMVVVAIRGLSPKRPAGESPPETSSSTTAPANPPASGPGQAPANGRAAPDNPTAKNAVPSPSTPPLTDASSGPSAPGEKTGAGADKLVAPQAGADGPAAAVATTPDRADAAAPVAAADPSAGATPPAPRRGDEVKGEAAAGGRAPSAEAQKGDNKDDEEGTSKLRVVVSVTSTPSGARVVTAHHVYGYTPVTIRLKPNNNYALTFSHEGYRPLTKHLTVDETPTLELAVTLRKSGAAPPSKTPAPAAAPPPPPPAKPPDRSWFQQMFSR